jgi:hypothetical protein
MKTDNTTFNFKNFFITTDEVSNEILTAFHVADDGEGESGPVIFAMTKKATLDDAKNITKYLELFGEDYGIVDIIPTERPCFAHGGDEPIEQYFITNFYSLSDVFSDYQIEVIKEFMEAYEDLRGNFNVENQCLMLGYLPE